jgi:hypothetical protein
LLAVLVILTTQLIELAAAVVVLAVLDLLEHQLAAVVLAVLDILGYTPALHTLPAVVEVYLVDHKQLV